MTYYEWVEYVRKLREGPIPDEAIAKLNSFPKETLDILIRFINQIVDLISYRLNATTNHMVNSIYTSGLDYNNLLLEINYVKQEIKYVKSLATLTFLSEGIKNDMNASIKQYGDDINATFKTAFANDTNPQIVLLVNNLDVNN